METIFVGIPAFNEEDLHQTIRTALSMAKYPTAVRLGVAMQYPYGDFPDLSMYPNVSYVKIENEPIGIGTCATRDMAVSLYAGETYYLQIDAHTIFKKNWDVILKANYKELMRVCEKPIISCYVGHWYKDKKTGQSLNMYGNSDFSANGSPWCLVPKTHSSAKQTNLEEYENLLYGVEGLDTPGIVDMPEGLNYKEHHLTSGHFLFTSAKFLEEVPFDPLAVYHEENTTPMRAWTRGYRIFSIKDHVLWTRELFHGRDVSNSWRVRSLIPGPDKKTFRDKIVEGSLRNKDILTGKILGIWGAPSIELLEEYTKVSGIDYIKFYKDMYKVVEETGDKYWAAKALYDLDKGTNGDN